jgi:hypothetical protein
MNLNYNLKIHKNFIFPQIVYFVFIIKKRGSISEPLCFTIVTFILVR